MHVVVGQGSEAVTYLERALSVEPAHPHALFELANVHLEGKAAVNVKGKAARGGAAIAAPLYVRSASSFESLLSAGV